MTGHTIDELLEEELYRARREGVSHAGNLPFVKVPAGATSAVLLVHGFSASPWEMRPLADDLERHGFASLAVRLPGHGTFPEDLARHRWEEWFDAVARNFDRLASHFKCVYGAGLSTGSLLLLALARERRPAGLVLLSPYLRLRHRLAPLAGWLRFLYPYHERSLDDPEAAHYYPRRPLAGVHQINRLLATLKPRLAEITTPVLAIHGEGDQTVDIDSGRLLVERLGSRIKVYERLGSEAPHVLTTAQNPHQQVVFDMIATFLQESERRCRAESR